MNLQEQLLRSRKLMCESDDEKLSLATDMLNTFLSYDGKIQYKALFDYESMNGRPMGVAVEATIDSAMYHEVSPNYDENYYKFVEKLDDKIYNLFSKYFLDEVEYTIVIYVQKNAEYVKNIITPMLKKAMDVYHKRTSSVRLDFNILKNKRRPYLTVYLPYDKNMGITFNHREFMSVLENLYPKYNGSVFDDFIFTSYITGFERGDYILAESVTKDKIICENCGWSWKKSEGGDDMYTCHKCGHEND